ncbi:unnamed protein product [Euphydryas editha]|uniref:Uncharacterized protein n=1 Tax=Euphydryas editha TaxID=104508 RepID=A0AAU9TX46_EUPED|nr:unnamed protein product [Euphydryas editha]
MQVSRSAELEPELLYEGYGFAHNTYHGPARHLRAPLDALTGAALTSLAADEARPLRFTDSPSSYAHASPSSYAPSAQPASTSGRGTALSSQASPRLADLYLDYREHFPPDVYYQDDLSPDSDDFTRRYWAPRTCIGLEPPRLRSSLKKNRRASPPPGAGSASPGSLSGAPPGTSTDSPSETDSSYASARDASGSARVRFSPDARRS